MIRVVAVAAVFCTPFKTAEAVVPPEGLFCATAREATPATRPTITARPTTMDVALVSRHRFRSVVFISFMIVSPFPFLVSRGPCPVG